MGGGEWAVHAPTPTEMASTERQISKNGSVLARTPHFGHGACVTYRETPHPSSVSPMAICIPIEHFGHGACALYSRRHPRVQSMGQPADTMSARAYQGVSYITRATDPHIPSAIVLYF